jgi:hypothetical protein
MQTKKNIFQCLLRRSRPDFCVAHTRARAQTPLWAQRSRAKKKNVDTKRRDKTDGQTFTGAVRGPAFTVVVVVDIIQCADRDGNRAAAAADTDDAGFAATWLLDGRARLGALGRQPPSVSGSGSATLFRASVSAPATRN